MHISSYVEWSQLFWENLSRPFPPGPFPDPRSQTRHGAGTGAASSTASGGGFFFLVQHLEFFFPSQSFYAAFLCNTVLLSGFSIVFHRRIGIYDDFCINQQGIRILASTIELLNKRGCSIGGFLGQAMSRLPGHRGNCSEVTTPEVSSGFSVIFWGQFMSYHFIFIEPNFLTEQSFR